MDYNHYISSWALASHVKAPAYLNRRLKALEEILEDYHVPESLGEEKNSGDGKKHQQTWMCLKFSVIFLWIVSWDSSPLKSPPFGRIVFGTISKHQTSKYCFG